MGHTATPGPAPPGERLPATGLAPGAPPSLLLRLGVDLKISFMKSRGRKSDSRESTAASSVSKSSVT